MFLRHIFPIAFILAIAFGACSRKNQPIGVTGIVNTDTTATEPPEDSPASFPTRLAIRGESQITSGICSRLTVVLQDSAGKEGSLPQALSVSLTKEATTNGSFYSTSSCDTAVTQVSVPASQTKADFFFRSSSRETATIRAQSPPMEGAEWMMNVLNPATLILSDETSNSFLSTILGNTSSKTLKVTNEGDVQATAMAVAALTAPFGFVGGSYPGTGGTCGATLNVGSSSCTLVLSFAPMVAGAQSQDLKLNYLSGIYPYEVKFGLSGTGVLPAVLTISGVSFDFGTIPVGSSDEKTFFIDNTASETVATSIMPGAALGAGYSYKGGSFPGTGGTCGDSLTPADLPCSIVIVFSPLSAGSIPGSINISYRDGVNGVNARTVTRALVGAGVNLASLSLSIPPGAPLSEFDFGSVTVNATKDQELTLSNTGTLAASSITIVTPSSPFSIVSGNCPSTLNSGASCTLTTRFSPLPPPLPSQRSLRVDYFNGSTNSFREITLKGTGISPAVLTLTPAIHDFGSTILLQQRIQAITVTNTGASLASLISEGVDTLSLDFSYVGGIFPGLDGTCTGSLGAGQNCTLKVQFRPTARGVTSDNYSVRYFDGAATQSVSGQVSGTGVKEAVLAISNEPFGEVVVGSSLEKTFTVTNSGDLSATSITPTLGQPSAPFTYTGTGGVYPGQGGTCGSMLNGGNSVCSLVLKFTPLAIGNYSSMIQLTFNNGIQSVSVSRGVSGTGTNISVLVLDSDDFTSTDFIRNLDSLLKLVQIKVSDDNNDKDYGFGKGDVSDNTKYNESQAALELANASNNTNCPSLNGCGTFISRLISGGGDTEWPRLSWLPIRPSLKELPNNEGKESGYPLGNIDMNRNQILYHFNSGSFFVDKSGHDRNASCIVPGSCNSTMAGFYREAASFSSGSNDEIRVPIGSIGVSNTSNITYEIWVKFNAATAGTDILKSADSADGGVSITLGQGGQCEVGSCFRGKIKLDSGNVLKVDDNNAVDIGKWYHVAVVRNGSYFKLFVNGLLRGSITIGTGPVTLPDIRIGSKYDGMDQLDGTVDEFAFYDRALSDLDLEILDRYRRGISTMKFQVRSCSTTNCETFHGPDGNSNTYYSELNNNLPTPPDINIGVANNPFFQYKVYLQTNNSGYMPQLRKVELTPTHYHAGSPSIVNTSSLSYSRFASLSETLGAGNEGNISYQLSPNGGTTWYYFSTTWEVATLATQSNSASVINSNASTFPVGPGNLKLRAFFYSPLGTKPVNLQSVSIGYIP